jgi:hypothetical protein
VRPNWAPHACRQPGSTAQPLARARLSSMRGPTISHLRASGLSLTCGSRNAGISVVVATEPRVSTGARRGRATPSGPKDPHPTRDYRTIKTLAPRFSSFVPSPVPLSLELIYRGPESPPPRLVVVSPSPCTAITAARIVVFRLGSFGRTCGRCFRAHCAGLTAGDEWICRRSRSTAVSTRDVVAR